MLQATWINNKTSQHYINIDAKCISDPEPTPLPVARPSSPPSIGHGSVLQSRSWKPYLLVKYGAYIVQ